MVFSQLLLAMYMSVSFRSANIQPNPNDFEFKGGLEGRHGSQVSAFAERENGIRYKGFKGVHSSKYTLLDIYYKEAQGIDRQSFGVKYPIENFSVGLVLNTIRWDDAQVLHLLRYQNEVLTMSYEIGENRQFLSSRLSQKLAVNDRIYIEPMMTYYKQFVDGNTTDFWQTRILIGYKFLE